MVGGWSYEVEGSVSVWNFRTWYGRDPESVEEMLETFRDVTAYPVVKASVFLLGEGGGIRSETFDLSEAYLPVLEKNGIERFALVSPDAKGLALKNVLNDVEEVDVLITEDEEEALEWASD